MKKKDKVSKSLSSTPNTEELLDKLANSACASRIIPPTQSLEQYLGAIKLSGKPRVSQDTDQREK